MQIKVDFDKITGVIKPMHAVNNGPVGGSTTHQVRGNFNAYKEAGIPYARTHDSSFFAGYGGEHTVDVHAIFPDFTKNPYDPASYDFFYTDKYLNTIIAAGTQVFFRFGSKIEHGEKKYGTIVPPDFRKWAIICEHIIRHYNEGWANGFYHNIIYWEIWNEPDGVEVNGNQPNWSGTPQEFYELYEIAATHLKSRFPHLKIGGPALSWFGDDKTWTENFFRFMTRDGKRVPLDFFSWHIYPREIPWIVECAEYARKILDEYGYDKTENILNEYNYLINWTDQFVETIKCIIGMRGAAFTAATMCALQKTSVDMLMYYDARPSAFNGLFDFYTYEPLKGYYPFKMFSFLYELKNEVESSSDDPDVYVTAAKNGNQYGAMVAYFQANKDGPEKQLVIDMKGLQGNVTVYMLNESFNCESVEVTAVDGCVKLDVKPDTVILIKGQKL